MYEYSADEDCVTPQAYQSQFDWFSFRVELCVETATEALPYWDTDAKQFCDAWPSEKQRCLVAVSGIVADGQKVVLENGMEFDNPLLPEDGGTCAGPTSSSHAACFTGIGDYRGPNGKVP
jgi:hypothetical protein